MKIQNDRVDKKRNIGHMSLIPESQDDIYELDSIINVGDIVKSHTQRKVQMDNKTQIKLNLFLKIKIETINVDLQGSIIYLKGRTCEENEHVKLGSYHTIEVELGKKFDLYKEIWTNTQLKAIKECTKAKQDLLFVVLYEKECVISQVGKNRTTIKNKIEIKNKKFANIVNSLANHINSIEIMVIASVSDYRNDLQKAIKNHKDFKSFNSICVVKLPTELKNSTNSKIINYVLTDPSTSKQFGSIKYVEDLKEINKFFIDFEKGSDLICIGKRDVDEGIEYGALDRVFLTDEIYRPSSVNERRDIEEFCKTLETYRIKLYIVPISHYHGYKLKELGGMAGILKFIYK
ncbi:Protein pelota [Nosema granulosis]|uniref:Protein pelota n=1 Tax=Nosema granulosis TaxID=83296 RepID=A0A9P6H1I7_9MICR|nr:Protein pelota [Nosema granulosis]